MNTPRSSGFTLIELVVATGLLALIMLMATGIFSRNITVQRRDIAQMALQEDVRFALELFSREARTAYGSTYALPDGSGSAIIFRNQATDCVMYRLNRETKQLERAETGDNGKDCRESDFTGKPFASIHSPDTMFETVKFQYIPTEVKDEEGLPDKQGFITVLVKAKNRTQADVNIELQTSVTSRQTSIYKPL